MAKPNNTEMEHYARTGIQQQRQFEGELKAEFEKDELQEADYGQPTQDDDCDKMLSIFSNLVNDIHHMYSKPKNHQIQNNEHKEETKRGTNVPKQSRSKSKQKVLKPCLEQNKVQQEDINDGFINKKRRFTEDTMKEFENETKRYEDVQRSSFTNQMQQPGDPRKFLRQNHEANCQLNFMISKYIYKVKTHRQWLLDDDVRQRLEENARLGEEYKDEEHLKPDNNETEDCTKNNYNGFVHDISNRANPMNNFNIPPSVASNGGDTNMRGNIRDASSQQVQQQNNFQQQNTFARPPNVMNANVPSHLPTLRNILNFQEVQTPMNFSVNGNQPGTFYPMQQPSFMFGQANQNRLPSLNQFATSLNSNVYQGWSNNNQVQQNFPQSVASQNTNGMYFLNQNQMQANRAPGVSSQQMNGGMYNFNMSQGQRPPMQYGSAQMYTNQMSQYQNQASPPNPAQYYNRY